MGYKKGFKAWKDRQRVREAAEQIGRVAPTLGRLVERINDVDLSAHGELAAVVAEALVCDVFLREEFGEGEKRRAYIAMLITFGYLVGREVAEKQGQGDGEN